MASKSRIPSQYRDHAAPDDILPKLTQAEANRRAEVASELMRTADLIGEADVANATRQHAKAIQNAMPYREFQAEVQRRQEAIANLPGTGQDQLDIRAGHAQAIDQMREANPYPRDTEKILSDEAMSATKAGKRDLMSKAELKAAVESEFKEQVRAMVVKDLTDSGLYARTEQLKKDIAEFKASQERRP